MPANSKKIQILLLLVVMLQLSGCGYSNPYLAARSSEENGADKPSLHITMWENQTGELGYQAKIYKRLIYWLNKSPDWKIIQDPEMADYLLSGAIKSADFPGLSYDRFENAKELRAEIRLSYKVREEESGEIILENDLTKRETFSVSDDNSAAATEGMKRGALDQIAEDIADEIYVRLYHRLSSIP